MGNYACRTGRDAIGRSAHIFTSLWSQCSEGLRGTVSPPSRRPSGLVGDREPELLGTLCELLRQRSRRPEVKRPRRPLETRRERPEPPKARTGSALREGCDGGRSADRRSFGASFAAAASWRSAETRRHKRQARARSGAWPARPTSGRRGEQAQLRGTRGGSAVQPLRRSAAGRTCAVKDVLGLDGLRRVGEVGREALLLRRRDGVRDRRSSNAYATDFPDLAGVRQAENILYAAHGSRLPPIVATVALPSAPSRPRS